MTDTFGEQVRARRVAALLTQAELAARAGISERTVSDLERGLRQGVYAVTAAALAEALAVEAGARPAFVAAARARRPPLGVRAEHTDDWRALRRTTVVGRDEELAAAVSALNEAQLVTVTGTGGIGKSRLAAEVCACLDAEQPGRVVWVSLAALQDPGLVLPAVAAAVGLAVAGDATMPALVDALRGRGCVLVLDTFEPVLAAAPVVAALLDRVSDLRLLVTSRAPLRLRGEQELPVGPLPDDVAAELFIQRAKAARPALDVTDTAVRTVVTDICQRLSGLPLALELAAARVRHMSLAVLATELAQPLRVLTGGERDLPERPRTMTATVEWSYNLLTPVERVVFVQLAQFSGGWSLPAAGRVCSEQPVLDALGRLCEHGLVHPDLELARWHLLYPIREFAWHKLQDAAENGGVARRHAEFVAELAEEAGALLLGADQARGRAMLRVEIGNLRAALTWATDTGDVDLALRLAGAPWMFWRIEGSFDEGRSWLRRALALGASPYRARALWGAAWLAYQQGDHASAAELGEELLSLSAGNHLDRRNALTVLSNVAMAGQRYDDAVALLEEALDIARITGARWHVASSLLNLGTAVLRHGDPHRAEQLLEAAAAAHTEAGDQHFVARTLIELGYASLVIGDRDGAKARLTDALGIFLDLDERWGAAAALAGFAALAAFCGDAATAAVLTGASAVTYEQIATQVNVPDAALAAPWFSTARVSLGEQQWATCVSRGRAMSIEQAASLVLQGN
jgi:predicted ATPase/DNA-binding XRE family transcriptional regulator